MGVIQYLFSLILFITLCVSLISTEDQNQGIVVIPPSSSTQKESEGLPKPFSLFGNDDEKSVENNNDINGVDTVRPTQSLPNAGNIYSGVDLSKHLSLNNVPATENNNPMIEDGVVHDNSDRTGSENDGGYTNSYVSDSSDKPVDTQNNLKDFVQDSKSTSDPNQEHSDMWKSYGEEKGVDADTDGLQKDDWYEDPTGSHSDVDQDESTHFYDDDNDPVNDEDEEEGDEQNDDDDEDETYIIEQWIKDANENSDWDQDKDDESQENDYLSDDSTMIENVVDTELANKNKQPTAPSSMVLFYTWMIVALLIMVVGISTYQSRCKGLKLPGMKQSPGDDRKRLIDHEYV